ncbi:hypothetical protein ACFE04_027760 [Oxalis oulophora]
MKVEEIQVDPPKEFEVRVKMLFASLCHTDLTFANGFPIPLFPRVLGHEGVGIVESIGEGVMELSKGDMVMPLYVAECGKCENCKSGRTNLCLTYPMTYNGLMLDGTSRMSVKGQNLYHVFSCSTWSEYTVVNANYVVKVDPTMDCAQASFLCCGFSTGFGAAWRDAEVEKGSTVAVLGLGAVGLGAVEGARNQGASKIIGIDKNKMKCEKGKAFGMTDFINTNESGKSIEELVKGLTGGMGVDYFFECSGGPSFVNQALESTKPGKGKAIMIGVANEPIVNINYTSLLFGRTLKGSIFGGLKPRSDFPEFELNELLTHEVSLGEINKALEFVKQPNCVKILIKIGI